MKARNNSWLPMSLCLALMLAGAGWSASTLHVSPKGQRRASGTKEKPVDLASAVARSSADMKIRDIVLAGGEYLANNINFRRDAKAKPGAFPRLVMRAAEGERVVFHQSVRVLEAKPVAGMPGVYKTTRVPPGDPSTWERDTRIRYVTLSNLRSVAAHPASCFADPEGKALYVHTSDGKPPAEHEVFFSLGSSNSRGLGMYRPNTTIENIHFRDFTGFGSHALVMNAPGLVARRCRFENAYKGIGLGTWATNNVIEDCAFQDVAQGVRHNGKDLIVRRCRFVKRRDRFLYRVYPALDTGVYSYFPASGTTITDCLVTGYLKAFRVKAKPGKYTIRHNTVVNCDVGMYWVTDNADSDTSYNIFAGCEDFVRVSNFAPNFTLDRNVFWRSRNLVDFAVRTDVVRGANRGKFNILADPRFVDPEKGDYRLLPDSPALALKDALGRPPGAYGIGKTGDAAVTRPALSLAFVADSNPCGATGELTFERDPWIGGGSTRIRGLSATGDTAKRLVGQPTIRVSLRAFDATGKIVRTRLKLGDAKPIETPYSPSHTVELPDKDGEYEARFQVSNDRNVWSKPASAVIRLDRQAPKLVGEPRLFVSDNGLIVAFRTDEPCFASVEYGTTPAYGSVAKTPPFVKRSWESADGGDWIETWKTPRVDHAVAILKPSVKTGQVIHVRIGMEDEGGLKNQSRDYERIIKGKPNPLYVSPSGKDDARRGTEPAPYQTLQYAVDRALPGDRVVLLPGVYTQYTLLTHGGLDEQSRITIEAATPGAAILDSAHREPSLIALEKAPFVTIRNLKILYYKKAGVYAYRSPHTVVQGCRFYNGGGSVKGYHAFFFHSPHSTVTRCLAVGAEVGLMFLESPHATVTHNTISQALYACARYDFSLAGTRQLNNSFTFGGNDNFGGGWHHPDELKTFRSDYNNFGTIIRPVTVAQAKKTDPPAYKQIMAERFSARYGTRRFRFRVLSKGIVRMSGKRYLALKSWRKATRQDKHSIFADPKYVKPWGAMDRWDWRLQPDSPNLGAGENGSTIGAFSKAE